MITEPMLAATIKDLEQAAKKFRFPLIVTPKLNGWRCLKVNGKVLTRKFKPIPNHHIRETLEILLPDGIDGEILCGTYNETQKACARREGKPDFVFHAFDYVWEDSAEDCYYEVRLNCLKNWVRRRPYKDGLVVYVPTYWVSDREELIALEDIICAEGHEGICIRTPDSPYKCGRSTLREQWLMKYKRFEDSEFEVIGFVEAMRNENPAEEDAFGRTKRGKKKEFMVGKGTLGALKVRDIHHGWEFELGTGWSDLEKEEIFRNKKKYFRKIGNYKYQKHGFKDKPPAASFQGWRYD